MWYIEPLVNHTRNTLCHSNLASLLPTGPVDVLEHPIHMLVCHLKNSSSVIYHLFFLFFFKKPTTQTSAALSNHLRFNKNKLFDQGNWFWANEPSTYLDGFSPFENYSPITYPNFRLAKKGSFVLWTTSPRKKSCIADKSEISATSSKNSAPYLPKTNSQSAWKSVVWRWVNSFFRIRLMFRGGVTVSFSRRVYPWKPNMLKPKSWRWI